jgi:hypothetical protein
MFDKIRTTLSKSSDQSGNSKYRDILKLQVGNVYTVRFVPDINNPEKTFYRYITHSWESFSTGNFISNVSPQTWGKRDPIAEVKFSLSKHGTPEEQERAGKILRRENWLANVYVVNDPTNPDNNGQVKLLRYGRQLHKIILAAVEGEDSDEFGAKVFDLSENGCNLKIKVERQGDFPTYVSSRFAGASKIKGMTDDGVTEVYDGITDLESVFPAKDYDDLKQVLNEHFYCKDSTDDVWNPEEGSTTSDDGTSSTKSDGGTTSTKSDDVDPLDDDKVKELLDGLGD